MKKVLPALLALFSLIAAPLAFADEAMPEIPADDSVVELPPMTDPADAAVN